MEPFTQGQGSTHTHTSHLRLPIWGFLSNSHSDPSVIPLHLFHNPKKGLQSLAPATQGVAGRPAVESYQLLVAVVGSVTVTCVTILLALLALFFIRKTLLNRRRTFTYQSGSVWMEK